ncbi:hypothetical protein ACIQTU_10420 [Brevundimonas sp. NPDC090276]|uniref:hypothetical protein n=1 Tax=Brevundimonas sp. NPDC090276 TaxID=3363956 RepID=UPI00383BC450
MSIVAFIMGASVLIGGAQASPSQIEVAQADAQSDQATQVDDVFVDGRSIQDQAWAFAGEVAAPVAQRGLARWRGSVCIGVVNISNQIGQALVDHISRQAMEVGLPVGEPGCAPNIIVTFTDDADGLAAGLVERSGRALHSGIGGMDRGKRALADFQTSDRPVRWWHVSMPVVGATGERAIRMPGDSGPIFVPGEGLVNAGRPIADVLNKAIIIVDVNRLEGATLPQLGDYIALVSLLQVDPDGDTRGFQTILNLFDNPSTVSGLTGWDRAYLSSLYDAYPERIDRLDQAAAMARSMIRAEREDRRKADLEP